MDFFDVVSRRYTHKAAFDPNRKVPDKDLRKIVEAGMIAPSAGNGQSAEFIIVNDEKIIAELGILSESVPLATTPAAIAVMTRPRIKEVLDLSTECRIADLWVATENMLLAATALGYRCGLVDGPFQKPKIRAKAHALLGIPDDRLLYLFMPVGYEAEAGLRRSKKPFEQRASWNYYEIER